MTKRTRPIKRRVHASIESSDYTVKVAVDVDFERLTQKLGVLTPDEREHVVMTLKDRMTSALADLPYGRPYRSAVHVR